MKVTTTHLSWSFFYEGMTKCAKITGHKRALKIAPIYLYDVRVIRSSDTKYQAEMTVTCCSLPIYDRVSQDSFVKVNHLLMKWFMPHAPEHRILSITDSGVQQTGTSSFTIQFEPRNDVEFTHSAVKLFLAVLAVLKVTDLPHGMIPYPHVYLETSFKTPEGKRIPFGEALVKEFYPTRVLA